MARNQRLDLEPVYRPKSIAVIGASPQRQASVSLFDNLSALKFQGGVFAVNPKYGQVLGRTCFADINDLPYAPDLVVLNVGAKHVVTHLRRACERGVRAAVIPGIGFGEGDGAGYAEEVEIVDLARAHGLAVVGPNCQGVVNYVDRSTSFIDIAPTMAPGRAALLAHSGSVTSTLLNNTAGVRWAFVASTGNESVISTADHAEYLLEQEEVSVLCAFVETIRDPSKFWEVAARAAESGKHIVILKPGRSDAARAMARAHSGALAPPDDLMEALFRQHGIVRVETLDEMLAAAAILSHPGPPPGRQLAAAVGSGGYAEILLDEVDRSRHLAFVGLGAETRAGLGQSGVPSAQITNPVDYWTSGEPTLVLGGVLDALAGDENVHAILLPTYGVEIEGVQRQVESERVVGDAVRGRKPTVYLYADGTFVPQRPDAGPTLGQDAITRGFRATITALDSIAEAACSRRTRPAESHQLPQFAAPQDQSTLEWLAEHGLDIARSARVSGLSEALSAAEKLGWPVVIKANDDALLHKTEAGAVIKDLTSTEALSEAVSQLSNKGYTDLLIQEQLRPNFEVMVAVREDPELGRFLIVGAGGIWTEQLQDVVVWPVGAGVQERIQHLQRLRCWPVLAGARNQVMQAEVDSLLELLETLEHLSTTNVLGFESLDLNPVILSKGRAALVDAVLVINTEGDTQ